jgi:nucleoside 2-deoxyribosyltransferase
MARKIKTYLAGDGLKRGNQILRNMERDAINQIEGIELFNPWDDKTINDKSKNPQAEQIFAKDTKAILDAEVIVVDADDDSVGTTCEVGQIWGVNYMLHRLHQIVNHAKQEADDERDFNEIVTDKVLDLLKEIPVKHVYWQNTDIRYVKDAEIYETGLRRSYSLNQYLYGCLLDLAGEDMTFDEILEELKRITSTERE